MSGLQETLDAIDLEDLLDELGLDWKRTAGGDELNLKECAFCGDDRWRVYMNAEKKVGVCFHGDCQRRFNAFSLARQSWQADNRNTIERLRRLAGTPARISPPRTVVSPEVDWSLPASVELPTEDGRTHPYLLDRGILLKTQARFGLRWCETGTYQFKDAQERPRRMDFSGRILLPILEADGVLASFVGRDATGKAELRYLFPPMLPSAGRYIYGAEQLGAPQHLVLGEGPFDAMAIHQAVYDHPDFRHVGVGASFGLSVSHADPAGNDQMGRLLRLKARGLQRVTLLWDGQPPAFLAALKAARAIERHGLRCHVGLLPFDTDPNEVDSRIVREAIVSAERWSEAREILWTLKNPYE